MIILWIAAGAGVILLYSAYKGKSPTSVLGHYASEKKDNGTVPNLGTNVPSIPTDPGGPAISASFTTDSNGLTVDLPSAYQSSPSTFIPSLFDGSNG